MNGQLILLLLTMLMQNPGSEILPGPNRGMPANPLSQPNQTMIPEYLGWGTDPIDNKFCLILQIAPESLAKFAQGPAGQEITQDIPEELRNRIQKIVVRVGTNPVERNPANPQPLAGNRTTNNPSIMNLDGSASTNDGRLASIDPAPRNANIYTAAQGGAGLAGSNGPNAAANNETGGFPNSSSTADYMDRSKLNGNNGNYPASSNLDHNNRTLPPASSTQDVLPTGPSSRSNDNFSPSPSQSGPLNIFQRSNNTNTAPVVSPGYASNNYPFPQNNNSSQANNSNHYPSNPNPSLPPSLAQARQYGLPPISPSPYSNFPYVNAQNTSFAQMPHLLPKQNNQQLPNDVGTEEQAKDKLLPFLLLFSIVGNVYLGLWMNHLRSRYRQLLSNMRGIPVSDLS